MKKLLSMFLLVCMLFSLTACSKKTSGIEMPQQIGTQTGSKEEAKEVAIQAQEGWPTEEGWLMSKLEMPFKVSASAAIDTDGDWLWISGRSQVDGAWCLVLMGLDTVGGQWQQFNLDDEDLVLGQEYDLSFAGVSAMSVKDGVAWMWVECSSIDYSSRTAKLVTLDTVTGETNSTNWNPENAFQSSDLYIAAFEAISADHALLISSEEACLIDKNFVPLANSSVDAYQVSGACEIGDKIYLNGYDCLMSFDTDCLSIGNTIPMYFPNGNGYFIVGDSVPGNILCSSGSVLYSVTPSGQAKLVLDWMDVAISRDTIAPYVFENVKGEYYGCAPTSKGMELVKVVKTQIPVKDTLTMACFFDTQSINAQSRMTGDMTDAILAYNNSDAKYRIEPVFFEYAGEQDLSRALMDAFSSNIDLVDQSNLPEGSISGSQLVDVLPLIDGDNELSRDDFFPAALHGMTWGGHMYRVSPCFSALGMNVPIEVYPGQNEWNSQWLQNTIAEDPSLALGRGKNYSQDFIVKSMAHAITGEFIDLTDLSCDFQRTSFGDWLELLNSLIDDTGLAEDRISFTCSVDSFYTLRSFYSSEGIYMGEKKVIVGFPDSRGNGFYLVSPSAAVAINGEYNGLNTSLSISGGCKDVQAAWDFTKQLLGRADNGVPVLRAVFDAQMDYNAKAYNMSQKDIDSLRNIVENAAGTVLADPALIRLISSELNAYISGDKSKNEVAGQLQSRVSLYLSEQS